MLKAGNKHPLKESLGAGENSGPSRTKRRRFDNVVLLREEEENSDNLNNGNRQVEPPRQILRAGRKRKKPTEETDHTPGGASGSGGSKTTSIPAAPPENDENDIISELAKEFKKARLRPVFFTISSFIEQTVGEVGFTMADEPETEVTVRLNLNLTTIKESKDETSSNGDDDKEYITDRGQHLVEAIDEPPDLIKECSIAGLGRGLLENCDSGSQDSSQIILRRQEIHQEEINNNG